MRLYNSEKTKICTYRKFYPSQKDLSPSQLITQIDLKLCALCQEIKEKKLSKPDGYETISQNLSEYCSLESFPLNLNMSRLVDGSGIKQTMEKTMLCGIEHVMVYSANQN